MPWLPSGGGLEMDSESVGLYWREEGVGSCSHSHTWALQGAEEEGAHLQNSTYNIVMLLLQFTVIVHFFIISVQAAGIAVDRMIKNRAPVTHIMSKFSIQRYFCRPICYMLA